MFRSTASAAPHRGLIWRSVARLTNQFRWASSGQRSARTGYERQILPGTFEHTLSFLIDNKIDLSVFEDRYHNDETGTPAYDPALLLKVVLFA